MRRLTLIITTLYFFAQLALVSTSCKHSTVLEDDTFPIDTTPVDPTNPVDTTPTDPGGNGGGGTPCDPNVVYFNLQVLPILQSNCTMSGCHDAASHQDGVVLTNYQSVMQTGEVEPYDLDDSDLYEVLVEDDPDKRMPYNRPPLSQAQIQVIANWILQGAQNLECDADAGGCNTDNVSYAQFIKPLIESNCQGCHSGSAPSGGVNLTTHAGVKAVATNGTLHGVTAWLPGYPKMPFGGSQLPDCTVDKIKAWIDAGAPNN